MKSTVWGRGNWSEQEVAWRRRPQGRTSVWEGMSRDRGCLERHLHRERCLEKETKILERKLFLAEGKEILFFPG